MLFVVSLLFSLYKPKIQLGKIVTNQSQKFNLSFCATRLSKKKTVAFNMKFI